MYFLCILAEYKNMIPSVTISNMRMRSFLFLIIRNYEWSGRSKVELPHQAKYCFPAICQFLKFIQLTN